MPKFVAISWWSGAGKSTVCHALLEKYPEKIALIQLDGYFNDEKLVPEVDGIKNWDHPDALDLDRLYNDLLSLQKWESVIVPVKDETLEKKDDELEPRVMTEIFSRDVILIEGFLCLYDERIRTLYESIIRLEVDAKTRWERRVHFKNDIYKEKILDPMFETYVLPTKVYATEILDVTGIWQYEVLERVERVLWLV